MDSHLLLIPIFLPIALGAFTMLLPARLRWGQEILSIVTTAIVLICAVVIWTTSEEVLRLVIPWTSFGIDFDLRAYHFAKFILLAAAGFEFLLALYTATFMHSKWRAQEYTAYFLISSGLCNGVILANNFVLMLVFLGAILLTLYGMISIGHPGSYKTSLKALTMAGIGDFCLMLGVIVLWSLVGTMTMSDVHTTTIGLGTLAFVLMAIGAMAKAGAMPLHTWIPDAATDAPLPFMAFLPAALEKLLGIYLLVRVALEFFSLQVGSALSLFLMSIGAITIVLAVLMALVQKDYKKLLSFHAISQVGYMILGIGTAVPIGIVGGIFHMLNHAMYKCTLFLTAGSVEKQAGTTELKKLGGLWKTMPITSTVFLVAALSISGVPPFNGFVSKEMVFHGAVETGYSIFAVAAWIGAILTFASFLKLGHAVYLGKRNPDTPVANSKDPDWLMKLPMIVIAAGCVLFGVYSKLPLKYFVEPVIEHLSVTHGHELEFWHHAYALNWIVGVSMLCLVAAFLMHWYGVHKADGKAYLASEPIHHLPIMRQLYTLAERGAFDLYNWFINGWLVSGAQAVWRYLDQSIDAVYEIVVVELVTYPGKVLQKIHNGALQNYAWWILIGMGVIVYSVLRVS
jgi:NADH-quinone oxidoreductase subunit L